MPLLLSPFGYSTTEAAERCTKISAPVPPEELGKTAQAVDGVPGLRVTPSFFGTFQRLRTPKFSAWR